MTHWALLAIVVASIALMLLRPRGIAEAWWVSAGAALLVILGFVTPGAAVRAVARGADVYSFLAGMMLLSALAQEMGVFAWLSLVAVRSARGSAVRLFTTVYALGTVVTIFLSNDATAVVLTPAILAAVRRARVTPVPYVFACALVANAASFVLPISNPANLVVFGSEVPPLGRWLAAFGLPSLVSIGVTYFVLRGCFRRDLRRLLEGEGEGDAKAEPLATNGKLVLGGLVVVVVVLLFASASHAELGLPTIASAVVVTGVICLRARTSPVPLLRGISWSTLLLVAGLFVMVDAVESAGALAVTREWLAGAERLPQAAGALLTGGTLAIANNLLNNLPLGLLAGATLRAAPTTALMTRAVLIGVDVGPNLAVTGSLATILWLIALRRENVEIGFWQFFRVGAIAMPVALLASLGTAIAMNAILGAP